MTSEEPQKLRHNQEYWLKKQADAAVKKAMESSYYETVELLKSQVDHKDGEIRALITTNARLADQNADLQARALPAPKSEVEPQGFWNRLFKRG